MRRLAETAVWRRWRLLLAVVLLSLLLNNDALHAAPFNLDLVHLGGIKGYVGEYEVDKNLYAGGMARVKTKIDEIRDSLDLNSTSLLLMDHGKVFGTTIFDQYFLGAPSATLLGQFGFAVSGLAQNDLYFGLTNLANYISKSSVPVVASNLEVTHWHPLSSLILPWHVVTVTSGAGAGATSHKVGFVGVTDPKTCERASCLEGEASVRVVDAVPALTAAMSAMRAAHPDVRFVVCNTPIESLPDIDALVEQVSGIGLFVSGDELHFSNFPAEFKLPVQAAYPRVVHLAGGQQALHVSVGGETQYLGHLRLTIGDDGFASAFAGDAVPLGACSNAQNASCVVQDAGVAERVGVWETELQRYGDEPLAVVQQDLDWAEPRCRFVECDAAMLVVDAMYWKMRGTCEISLLNVGAVRNGFPQGSLTVGGVLGVIPFTSLISTFQLRGNDLVDTIQHAVSQVPVNQTEAAWAAAKAQSGSGKYLAMAGLRVRFDPAKPVGSKVGAMEVWNEAAEEWTRVATTATYSVCAPDFIRTGGDGYSMLQLKALFPYDNGPSLQGAVIEYVKELWQVKRPEGGRVIIEQTATYTFFCSSGCNAAVGGGKCVGNDVCACNAGWTGSDCLTAESGGVPGWLGVLLGVGVPVVVVVFGLAAGLSLRNAHRRRIALESRSRNLVPFEELVVGEVLGVGASGEVFAADFRGTKVALKKIRLQGVDGSSGPAAVAAAKAAEAPQQQQQQQQQQQDGSKGDGASSSGGGGARGKHFRNNVAQSMMQSTAVHQKEKSNGDKPKSSSVLRGLTTRALTAPQQERQKLKNTIEEFQREIDVMMNLRHPNIVLFMGSCPPPNICIITEFMEKGSVWDILRNGDIYLSWKQRLQMMLDASRGMMFLHSTDPVILHCDLKSANLLVDANDVVKVADFGLTQFSNNAMFTKVGTFSWMAPEVIQGEPYEKEADVYSFGVILYEAWARKRPYAEFFDEQGGEGGDNMWTLLDMVCYEDYRPRFEDLSKVPRDFLDLARSCWSADQFARPLFVQVVSSLQKLLASASSEQVEDFMGTGRTDGRVRLSSFALFKTGDLKIRAISPSKQPFAKVHTRVENGIFYWYRQKGEGQVQQELDGCGGGAADHQPNTLAGLATLGVEPAEAPEGLELGGCIVLKNVVTVKRSAMQIYLLVEDSGAYALSAENNADLQSWMGVLEEFAS